MIFDQMQLVDTHCHLNFKSFRDDYSSVAKKSKQAGIKSVVVIGSDYQTSLKAIEVAREINNEVGSRWAYVAVGIHPIHFENDGDFIEIEKLAKDELVVAIGETGLDFYRCKRSVFPRQKELMIKHIDLANSLNIPVIFHNREADEEFASIWNEIKAKKAVFHCFSSDHNFAREVMEKGYLISFTGNITYGNKKLKKVIKRTPIERIMVETDAPYMVPEPLRSKGVKRNEPYMVLEVAKKIALEKNIDISEVAKQTTQNAIDFFNLK